MARRGKKKLCDRSVLYSRLRFPFFARTFDWPQATCTCRRLFVGRAGDCFFSSSGWPKLRSPSHVRSTCQFVWHILLGSVLQRRRMQLSQRHLDAILTLLLPLRLKYCARNSFAAQPFDAAGHPSCFCQAGNLRYTRASRREALPPRSSPLRRRSSDRPVGGPTDLLRSP